MTDFVSVFLYGALILGALTRLGADRTSALCLIRGLDRMTDEKLEAAVEHGRTRSVLWPGLPLCRRDASWRR